MISSYQTGRLGGFTDISFSRLRRHVWRYCCAICERLRFLQSPPGTGYFPAAASLCQTSSPGTVTGRHLQLPNSRISEPSCPVSPHLLYPPLSFTHRCVQQVCLSDSNPSFQKKIHPCITPPPPPQLQQELSMIDTSVRYQKSEFSLTWLVLVILRRKKTGRKKSAVSRELMLCPRHM